MNTKELRQLASGELCTYRRACCGGRLEVTVLPAGNDLCVLLTGGHSPHVGCVALGIPRPSLKPDGEPGATVSTLNVTGHKDDAVANRFAARLAARSGRVVSVTCGIHFHEADSRDIEDVLQTAEELLRAVEDSLPG